MNIKLQQLLPATIVSAILLAAAAGFFITYRLYGGDIAYYAYEQKAKGLADFDSRKDSLRSAFRAIHANPKDAQNYVDLGSAQYGLQDYRAAEKNYLKALLRAPTASVIFWNLSHLYIQTKEYGKAEKYAKMAIERLPERPLGYEALGELYRYYLTEKEPELPGLYTQAFEKTGDSVFLLLKGGYYRDHNEPDKAIDAYNTWIALNPNQPAKKAVEEEIKNLE